MAGVLLRERRIAGRGRATEIESRYGTAPEQRSGLHPANLVMTARRSNRGQRVEQGLVGNRAQAKVFPLFKKRPDAARKQSGSRQQPIRSKGH